MEIINNKLPRVEAVIMAEGIELYDRGSYYQGKCPFHLDINPSLVVYKDSIYFKCFGCHAFGDAIAFIMKYKNKTFKEALQYLNINDFKFNKPIIMPGLIDIIADEEAKGIDVKSKYGNEFIQTMIMKTVIKESNNNKWLQNKVKVNKIADENDKVLGDKLNKLQERLNDMIESSINTLSYGE